MITSIYTRSTRHQRLGGVLLLLVGCLLFVPPVHGQSSTFEKAQTAYQFAEYEKAIDLFTQVANSTSVSAERKKQALRYLGRAYIARNKKGEAREAIRRLIKTEPPLVELNPNMEPPPVMNLYYEVRKEMNGYKVQKQRPGMQTLAVMDFSNNSIDQRERFQGLSKGLPAMMINYLNQGTDLKVIERERIEWLLNELKLQQKEGIVDQSTAVRTGKLLGANAVVFGSYTVFEDRMMIQARVVKVETGEILLGEQVMGKPDEFYTLIEDLSMEITRSLNVAVKEQKMGGSDTKSLDAMMAYSDGLNLLEDGKYRAAYEKFLQAAEYDKSFKRAKIKAKSLRPLLVAQAEVQDKGTVPSSNMNR
ncbi:CsgG/HfaB family protein [Salisaeta longa]|uniref:CsgG/HfaB family protein n=1 Tax=Salisaeta longa TaxID=503170 RepID=UPI00048EE67A|nr:CsgG/HfaB family protein [Salisaeta longa]